MTSRILFGTVLAAMASVASADTIYCTSYASDGYGASSFNEGTCWSDGNSPTAGNDYVWNSPWGLFRTPQRTDGTVHYSFKGDSLRFEGSDISVWSTSWLSTPDNERCNLTFPDLILAANNLWVIQQSAPNSLAWILGSITVEEDFCFKSQVGASDDQCHYDFRIGASLKGGEGKTISIGHWNAVQPTIHCPNIVHLTGDNVGYQGKWKVNNYAADNTLEGMVMSVESATALGSVPDTPMADAVTLFNNGALAVAPELCADGPFAPANRGITLDAPAGRLTTLSDESWSLGMPIVGDYPLVKGGAGRVTLCGSYSGGAITVEQGTLRFGEGFSAPAGMPTVSVEDGAAFELEASAAGATFAGFAVPEGTLFVVPLNIAEGAARTIALDAASSLPSGKLRVTFGAELPLDAASEAEFPILTVPASVRTLTADDIENVTPQNAYGLPRVIFTVKDNAAGVQTVYAKIRQLVVKNAAAQWDSSRWWTSTEQWNGVYLWEDEKAAHPGADYLITNNVTLRAAVREQQEAVDGEFAGESLTFYGDGILAMKCRRMTFKDLRLSPGRQVAASGCGEEMQYVAGQVTAIGGFDSQPVHFDCTKTQGITLEAACHGAGTLQMQVYENDDPSAYTDVWAAITGDNSDFRGKLYFYSKYGDATTKGINCRFNSPENLGGPMASATFDGIDLGSNSALSPTRSMTLDTANRGIYVSVGRFDIPEDVDLTVKQPLSLNGTLAKEGEGTLTLSTTFYFGFFFGQYPGNNNYFEVRAGGVRPTTVNALKRLRTTFRQGARLILDAEPVEEDLAEQGVLVENEDGRDLSVPDGVLNVEIAASQVFLEAHPEFSVPVCTVSQSIADNLDGKIKIAKVKGWQGVVSKETLPSGMVRFTANLAHKGAVLILR